MEIRQLQNPLRTVIEPEETECPVVSYFRDCEDPGTGAETAQREELARHAAGPVVALAARSGPWRFES
jgi:hypothetical protein